MAIGATPIALIATPNLKGYHFYRSRLRNKLNTIQQRVSNGGIAYELEIHRRTGNDEKDGA